jgi:hypothetical protein
VFKVHFSTTPNLSGLTGPMGNAYRAAARDALAQTGGHVRKMVRTHIESGGSGWRGLSAMTRAMRSRILSPLFNLAQLVRFKVGSTSGKLRVQIGFFPTAKKKKADPIVDATEKGVRLLALCTVGWRTDASPTINFHGKDHPYSVDAAIDLYTSKALPWVKEQIDSAVHSNANFMKP